MLDIGELHKTDSPTNGDYVVYQDLENYPDNLTHVGILENGKVVSKWAWEPLIKHDIWDVPAEYGNDVFYTKAVTNKKALDLFTKYKANNKKPVSRE